MVKKRRRHTAAFKFSVALELLEVSKTISQLSSEREFSASQMGAWKRQLLKNGPLVFAAGTTLTVLPRNFRRWFLPWILVREMGGNLVKQSNLQKHLNRTFHYFQARGATIWPVYASESLSAS